MTPSPAESGGRRLRHDDSALLVLDSAADFDLVRLVNGAEVGRDRWTLSLQFTFLDTVDPELMIVNPMGILITYVRGDHALVTG